jgi:hypothetical protein
MGIKNRKYHYGSTAQFSSCLHFRNAHATSEDAMLCQHLTGPPQVLIINSMHNIWVDMGRPYEVAHIRRSTRASYQSYSPSFYRRE